MWTGVLWCTVTTHSSNLGSVAPRASMKAMRCILPVDEEDTELLDGFEESTVGEEVVVPRGPALREALESLDLVDTTRMFALRGAVMKTVPKFLFGPFRNALKFAMEEARRQVSLIVSPCIKREGGSCCCSSQASWWCAYSQEEVGREV